MQARCSKSKNKGLDGKNPNTRRNHFHTCQEIAYIDDIFTWRQIGAENENGKKGDLYQNISCHESSDNKRCSYFFG